MKGAVLAAALFLLPAGARAGEVNVAVAANFADPAKEIAGAFESSTGHKAILSFGATGQLYAQITQGAPFGVFLSADEATVKRAQAEGFAVAGAGFTYAVGALVLWSKSPASPVGAETLASGKFDKLALANPKLAPYGAAAVAAMKSLGVYDRLQPKFVQGANIGQTLQFADSGAAEYAFVALSQVIKKGDGAYWIVPASAHSPIRQDAALLKKAENDPVAKAFLAFLQSPAAVKLMETYGYGGASGAPPAPQLR